MSQLKVAPFSPLDKIPTKLNYQEYIGYYEALLSDNESYVRALLSKADSSERGRLLNAEFDYRSIPCPLLLAEVVRSEHQCLLPLHLAVTSRSLRVAKLLIQQGAEVATVDSEGYNLLHSCVAVAFYLPDTEAAILETITELCESIKESDLEQLVEAENLEGMRPVEFAVQQGTLVLLKFYMLALNKKQVVREETVGLSKFLWYNVEEYESPKRHRFSPIVLFAFLDRNKAVDAVQAFLECPFFGVWMRAKYRANMLPILIWAILRAVYVTAYFVVDRNAYFMREMMREQAQMGMNVSKPCFTHTANISKGNTYAVGAFIIAYAVLSVGSDIFEAIWIITSKRYRMFRNLKGWKSPAVSFGFYRYCTFMVNMSVFICSGLMFTSNMGLDATGLEHRTITFFRILVPIHACWSMLFFVQLLPVVGKSILAIRGMLGDMLSFMLILCIVLAPFTHTLNVYMTFYNNDGCAEQFDGIFMTAYSLFLMILNMVDLTSFDVQNHYFLYMFHFVYVFVVAIMLLNFLVAIMSESASRVAETELVTEWLHALAISSTIQERFGAWLLRPYYRLIKPRVFTVNRCGALCVVVQTNRMQELKDAASAKESESKKK